MARTLPGTNIMPGGRVHEIQIEPKFVRYASGSRLSQAAASITNSRYLTASIGFRAPGTLTTRSLLEFGDQANGGGGLYVNANGSLTLVTSRNEVADGEEVVTARDTWTTATGLIVADTKYHVFVSVDTNHTIIEPGVSAKLINLYIDGVDREPPGGTSNYLAYAIGVNGFGIGLPAAPAGVDLGVVDLSNKQVWFGQYIDPAGTSTGKRAKDGQSALIREIVDAANDKGIDPLIALTFLNVESGYGNEAYMNRYNNLQYKGIFQFNQTEMNRAGAAQNSGTNLWNNSDQFASFLFFMASGETNTWGRTVGDYGLEDTDGMLRYLVHNQGPGGYRSIMDALVATPDRAMGGGLGTNPFGQAWETGIGRTSATVTVWFNDLVSFWLAKQADAASRLTDSTADANIDFFYKEGEMRLPTVAQDKFGRSDILFWGQKSDYIVDGTAFNDGTGANFTAVNPGGITDAA